MADEGKGAEGAGKGEEGKDKGEEKKVDWKARAESAEKKLKDVEKPLRSYEQINARFKSDEKFQQTFNAAWKGDEDAIKKMYGMTDAAAAEGKGGKGKADFGGDDGEDDPITALQNENKALKDHLAKNEDKINKLTSAVGFDKFSAHRSEINVAYKNEFESFARQQGYAPGEKETNVLFKITLEEAKKLATKYNLVDEEGNVDPLINFSPEMIREATENAIKEMRDIGYDVQERSRQTAMDREQKKVKSEEEELNKVLGDPKELKDTSSRAKALERGLAHLMRTKYGVDIKNMKFV